MNHYVFDCKCHYLYDVFLDDERGLFYFLKRMADMHKLNAISEPILRPYYECKTADVGISVVMFLENGGHITCHTFPTRHCFYMDILTDKDEFLKAKAFVSKFMPYLEEQSNIRQLKKSDSNERFNKRKDFGPHLIYEIAESELDMAKIFHELKELPERIGMTAIMPPIVLEDGVCVDGITVIAESHISIHYRKDTKTAYIDVFSCMPFDYGITDKYISMLGKIVSKKVYARANKKEKSKGEKYDDD